MGLFLVVWPSIGIVVVLLFAIGRFVYREKYAESIRNDLLKDPEERKDRFLKYEHRMVSVLRLGLWPFLLLLILLPFGLFFFVRKYVVVVTLEMVMAFLLTLNEYRFRKWLINYLEGRTS